MHWPTATRMFFLSIALAFTPTVNAGAALDEMVMDRVMPRFDREARVVFKNSGARYVSSNWNGETRTLVAVGEMDVLDSPGFSRVALKQNAAPGSPGFKNERVDDLCRHPAVRVIRRFLEKHDVTIAFIYGEKYERTNPVTVEISYRDLSICA